MRIIDIYNYIATAACVLLVAAAVIVFFRKGQKSSRKSLSDKAAMIAFAVIFLVGAALRLFKIGQIPLGLQQDEASIGYDAFCLVNYGIDRNGYPWPIYPITWGCGGGSPLLIYLNVISTKLFGTGITKLRLIPAILGTATIPLLFATLREGFREKSYRNEAALIGAGFLAVCPWHIILSRWSLDCNIMPFNMMLAIYFFVLVARKKSTGFYALSAASFAVCMYSYGAATIVVPVTILIACIYAMINRALNFKQLIISGVTFLVIFLPLLVFYGVNYLGLPEILTPYFSFNKFTSARTGEAFIAFNGDLPAKLLHNLKSVLLAVTIGDSAHTIAHYYPGYASLYEFTFPVTFLGIVVGVKEFFARKKDETEDGAGIMNAVFVAFAAASIVLGLVIIPDINRLVMLFVPCIYFFVKGGVFILENTRKTLPVLAGIVLVAALSFTRDYFTDYSHYATSIYMPGYGDAMKRAYDIAGDERQVRSTYEGLSAPFMLTLYYTEYDPHKFYSTVEYKDPYAEFRIARSFGNFIFELPEDVTESQYADDVFVVASSELSLFPESAGYTVENFGGYHLIYREN
ncbi:ArnT family glycosyltransferase [Butyrivibrio sp. FCS014]|uniref:ArnT family glycosyltransferase n=1 Tax=Butyrivibrio sp. FCS014 TaxID=1408304 RepID=UPI000467383A|nr:glycosyltransferase family 39 protein [Butyrivibrio sp. FCS014]